MTAVFGVGEHVARFAQNVLRKRLLGRRDAAFLREKTRFAPVFPRLERLAVDFGRKPNAETLIDVNADDENPRTAREVGSVLPQGAVGRVVVLSDSQRFDGTVVLYTPKGFNGFSPM